MQALIALYDAIGNTQYMTDAMIYMRNAIQQFTQNNVIYEGCDQTNTCSGDQLAFRGRRCFPTTPCPSADCIVGIFYLGLARLYERTKDESIGAVIEASYLAMLSRVCQTSLLHGVVGFCVYRKWAVGTHCL